MQKHRNYPLILITLLICLFPMMARVSAQEESPQGTAIISSPTDNEQLFGLIQITGTATHPSEFAGYRLDFSNAKNPQEVWLEIQPRLNQTVENGVLGQWDTATLNIPDGTYRIRLQVFLTDGTVLESKVSNLTLRNTSPTNVPTVAPAQPLPTLPQDQTDLIEQPPTLTPAPTLEQPVVETDPAEGGGDATFINYGAIQSAFCGGAFFSVIFFGIIIAYLMLRSRISPFTSRLWWQIRSELRDDREDY